MLDFSLLSAINNEGDDLTMAAHPVAEQPMQGVESLKKNRSKIGQLSDSSLMRTVTAVEQMKQNGERNTIMEKDEIEDELFSSNDRASESQRLGSSSPPKDPQVHNPDNDDEMHTKRMQSFVVRKVTKIYDKRNTSSLVSRTDSVLSAKR